MAQSGPIKDPRHVFGAQGEKDAVRWLKKKGHRIQALNYRSKFGEVDIISLDGETVVFTEVRSRTSCLYGYPEETVTREKQMRLRKTAEVYLLKTYSSLPVCRFDVIAISPDDAGQWSIRHYENAF